MAKPAYKMTLSIDGESGKLGAFYVRVRSGRVFDTREITAGKAFADYDRNGLLIGVELLAPCTAKTLSRIARNEPSSIRQFLLAATPRQLVTT